MRHLILTLTISLFGNIGLCQDNKLTVKLNLSLTDLYVVHLEIIEKINDGLCDCSVGQKKKNNKCELYKIKIRKIKYQVDSTVFSKKEIFKMTKLIVSKDLVNKIKQGSNLTAILTNTSSKDYLQLKSILTPVIGKEFSYTSDAHLTSLIECKDNQLTFREK